MPVAKLLLASVPFLLPLALPAQKAETAFEWAKRNVKICYESLPVGTHSVAELQIGAPWRLGATHDASTWQPTMPILVGDTWLAPGHYRVNLQREDESKVVLVADGSGDAVGGGTGVRMPGKLGKTQKPAKKLAIEFAKAGAPVGGNQPAQVVLQFGADEWRGDLLVLGGKTVSLPGGKLSVFSVPAANLEKGAVPIATWATGKDAEGSWNIVLDGEKVRFVPWMRAPKTIEDKVEGPDSARIVEGKVARLDTKIEKPFESLELQEATMAKGEMRLVIAFASSSIECRLPDPKAKK